MIEATDLTRYRADLVLAAGAPELLRIFNSAAVLAPADVHLAVRLAAMAAEDDDAVGLALALAGRAPRVGHVSVDLATVRSSVVVGEEDAGLDLLPWPEPASWIDRLAASPLVEVHAEPPDPSAAAAAGTFAAGDRPLHLAGSRLYLDRYWRDEIEVADDLRRRAVAAGPLPAAGYGDRSGAWLARRLDDLFPGDPAGDQRAAAATAMSGGLAVIAGGPGTGKTTTVARLLALIIEQAAGSGARPPLIGMAAPTGKAAARMEEAIRAEASRIDVPGDVRRRLAGLAGVTLHRLLGARPDHTSRFRHHRGHRLPHDVVVVDEASMVSLALMARLAEAVRPDARLVLVGDPEQLVSVEAGAVLADIVGSVADAAPGSDEDEEGGSPPPLAGRVVLLRTNHRFSGDLAELASAVRDGDADRTVETLRRGSPSVRWLRFDPSQWPGAAAGTGAGEVRTRLVEWASGLVSAGRTGDAAAALDLMQQHRLLCAHREGPAGVAVWNQRVEEWLAEDVPDLSGEGVWYPGRPVMVTANDYSLQLFNGDTGVVVAPPVPAPAGQPAGPSTVAFPAAGGTRGVSPYRLSFVDTVYATTVHKSQGSEFDRVTLVLPAETSRLLTRELLYTAVTRARRQVLVVGTEMAVRRAVGHPLGRASGLASRLWGT